jgi:hypothetical protein
VADAGPGPEVPPPPPADAPAPDSSPPAWAYPPACLRDLFATCPLTGSCREGPLEGGGSRVCYASGVKQQLKQISVCGRSLSTTIEMTVTRADGSLCYTLQVENFGQSMACERGRYTWRDAANQVVATGRFVCDTGCEEWAQCAGSATDVSCGRYCNPRATDSPRCEAGECR